MQHIHLFAAFAISIAATLLAIPPVRRAAIARAWVDVPDGDRKIHDKPIVCVGGIAIAVGSIVGVIYLSAIGNLLPFDVQLPHPGFWIAAAVVFAMGLFDDLKGMDFKQKFAIQLIAAYGLLFAGFRIDVASIPFLDLDPYTSSLLSIPLTLIWIVGIINATNLMDGLDGLAAGLCAIAFGAFAVAYGIGGNLALVALALPVLGSLTGFLFHNFNPANIFMGNSGSYLLGISLAAYSLQQPLHQDPLVAMMVIFVVLGLPVVDTSYAMLRRLMIGKSPFSADRDHVHHRLICRYRHRDTVLILYGVASILAGAGIAMASASPFTAFMIFVGVLVAGFGFVYGSGRASARRAEGRPTDTSDTPVRHERNALPGLSRRPKVLEGQA